MTLNFLKFQLKDDSDDDDDTACGQKKCENEIGEHKSLKTHIHMHTRVARKLHSKNNIKALSITKKA